jgi:hypothetical protein
MPSSDADKVRAVAGFRACLIGSPAGGSLGTRLVSRAC